MKRGGADELVNVVMPQGSDVANHPAIGPGRGRGQTLQRSDTEGLSTAFRWVGTASRNNTPDAHLLEITGGGDALLNPVLRSSDIKCRACKNEGGVKC